jgi:hypothetical protein
MAISSLTLGRKSTTYSAPRYSSVCPFWRPNPLTSETVSPCTPISPSAWRTSSSLKGLTIAVMIFMHISELNSDSILATLGKHANSRYYWCFEDPICTDIVRLEPNTHQIREHHD